ncbi:guanine nucleotide-binding protein subunit gamma [Colletotrichum paranaense]|uniref:Guanine nucleotide-binding protein subunit gamma n=4 Tax=Colletotrichum acutatum species complex TaxID=2707335 RepID=A0A9P9X5J0_9PEZI|nr:guanine nucleotide-binding protein subunit gamma [Colletotrichum costaricense]XP_060341933.1 guanine nucleotide-binding protein subunit gamma [Colletotrichum paranaense]XP_060383245.1 guanine nucleotide-binding protein subunit gamma [Colletotrichum tamarilloi]XP_060391818.1 guanine nucleotide-binding protein subunit gamma [Colletotrichum abscissum]KAI3527372.1 guanine nucleotide-binding protein subunit gamma [Colletotrichum filicis]KAI3537297.1 guanine nucleotide-binding protein subunit gam
MLSHQERSSHNTTTTSPTTAESSAVATTATSPTSRQRQDQVQQPRSDDKQSRRQPAAAEPSVAAAVASSSATPSSSKSPAPRSATAMPQYTSRDVGDPSQIKKNKQSMADLKLRRLTELNNRLREDLERERIPVSNASKSIIAYCNSTRDYMVPSVWGAVPRGEDPYAPQQSGGCCLVM